MGYHGPRRKGSSDATSVDKTRSSAAEDDDDDEEEEEENNPPPDEGRKKRAAPTILETEAPKKGKSQLANSSAWDADTSPERRPLSKTQAAS